MAGPSGKHSVIMQPTGAEVESFVGGSASAHENDVIENGTAAGYRCASIRAIVAHPYCLT